MFIHFTTQNFKHDTENFGYIGNPGLVDSYTGNSEISCGCYLDVNGCFTTNVGTFEDTYSEGFSFHGFVPLIEADVGELRGRIIDDESYIYSLFIKCIYAEDSAGSPVGKLIRVAIMSEHK